MKDTKIEWCDHSWSPWRGCTKVSPGCANCYAETLSKRNPAVLGQWGKGKPRVKAKNWNEPRKWNRNVTGDLVIEPGKPDQWTPCKRPTVFPSLCDWLDDDVPIEWLAEFLQLIHATPNLTWLLLTKRPENWRPRLESVVAFRGESLGGGHRTIDWLHGIVPHNVWLGTSVEDQQRTDERIPQLLKIPAAGRFLSLEPLLGPVDMALEAAPPRMPSLATGHRPDWLIIGGESGNGARPCNVEWIRSLVRQGQAAGVPTFVKQLGAVPMGQVIPGLHWSPVRNLRADRYVTHPKGGDPAEWPEDLRVRQFPDWAHRS